MVDAVNTPPIPADYNPNARLDLQFFADRANGGPTDTATNRAGFTVPSVRKEVADTQAAINAILDPVTGAVATAQAAAESAAAIAGAMAIGHFPYATKALLTADLTPPAGAAGEVLSDTTLAFNGIYAKVGATGTGSWTFIGPNPAVTGAAAAAQVGRTLGGLFNFDLYGTHKLAIGRFFGANTRVLFAINNKWQLELYKVLKLSGVDGTVFDLDSVSSTSGYVHVIKSSDRKVHFGFRRTPAGKIIGGPIFKQDLLAMNKPADTATALFYSKIPAGGFLYQVFRFDKSTGQTAQLTTLGNNINPTISADGTRVVYSSDRNGRSIQYDNFSQPVAGGIEAPMVATSDVIAIGDSLTDFLVGYTPALATAIAPRKVQNAGRGGFKSTTIAAYYGAIPCMQVIAGNSIPASGSVSVTQADPLMAILAGSSSIAGYFITSAGTKVQGVLSNSGGLYSFLRDAAGVAAAVPNPAVFVPTTGFVDGSLTAANATPLVELYGRTAIIWVGRNDTRQITLGAGASYSRATLLANYAAIFATQAAICRKCIVIGQINGEYDLPSSMSAFGAAVDVPTSDAVLTEIAAVNAALFPIYGGRFLDMLAAAKTAGLTTSRTVNGNTRDVINLTASTDGVHLDTPTGRAFALSTITTALALQG